MNTQAIFNHFADIIAEILETDETAAEYLMYGEEDLTYDVRENLYLCSGVTRMVLVDDDYPYVVKMDMLGFHYCEREVELRELAYEKGLEALFAPITYVGEYVDFCTGMSWKLYAAPRYDCGVYDCACSTDEERTTLNHYKEKGSPLTYKSYEAAMNLLHNWGMEVFDRLNTFCIEHHINDIHRGNIARVDGKIILIDYAGYHKEDQDEEFAYGDEEDYTLN